MNKIITYYYLQRKQDRYIFYVGQTTVDIALRLRNHIQDSKTKHSPKDIFIKKWITDIEIIPFETVVLWSRFDIYYREKYWITTFLKYGHPLLNNTLQWMCKYNFKNYWPSTHHVSNDYYNQYKEYEKYIW